MLTAPMNPFIGAVCLYTERIEDVAAPIPLPVLARAWHICRNFAKKISFATDQQ